MSEEKYTVTLFEACEFLSKTRRTVGRYVKNGLLNPIQVKSRNNTLEYRFEKEELEAFKATWDETRQDTGDGTDGTGQDILKPLNPTQKEPEIIEIISEIKKTEMGQDRTGRDETRRDETGQTGKMGQDINTALVKILQDTAETLRGQLEVKDKQIHALNEQLKSKDLQISESTERWKEANHLIAYLQTQLSNTKSLPENNGIFIKNSALSGEPKVNEDGTGQDETRRDKTGQMGKMRRDRTRETGQDKTGQKKTVGSVQKPKHEEKPKKKIFDFIFGR